MKASLVIRVGTVSPVILVSLDRQVLVALVVLQVKMVVKALVVQKATREIMVTVVCMVSKALWGKLEIKEIVEPKEIQALLA